MKTPQQQADAKGAEIATEHLGAWATNQAGRERSDLAKRISTHLLPLFNLVDACRNFNGRCRFHHSGQGNPCGKCIDCRLRELPNSTEAK